MAFFLSPFCLIGLGWFFGLLVVSGTPNSHLGWKSGTYSASIDGVLTEVTVAAGTLGISGTVTSENYTAVTSHVYWSDICPEIEEATGMTFQICGHGRNFLVTLLIGGLLASALLFVDTMYSIFWFPFVISRNDLYRLRAFAELAIISAVASPFVAMLIMNPILAASNFYPDCYTLMHYGIYAALGCRDTTLLNGITPKEFADRVNVIEATYDAATNIAQTALDRVGMSLFNTTAEPECYYNAFHPLRDVLNVTETSNNMSVERAVPLCASRFSTTPQYNSRVDIYDYSSFPRCKDAGSYDVCMALFVVILFLRVVLHAGMKLAAGHGEFRSFFFNTTCLHKVCQLHIFVP
jgi:hypothetical protein